MGPATGGWWATHHLKDKTRIIASEYPEGAWAVLFLNEGWFWKRKVGSLEEIVVSRFNGFLALTLRGHLLKTLLVKDVFQEECVHVKTPTKTMSHMFVDSLRARFGRNSTVHLQDLWSQWLPHSDIGVGQASLQR